MPREDRARRSSASTMPRTPPERIPIPTMPIKPGIVKVRSRLKTETGLTVLASCITLTPGTLTIDVTNDGIFYIHWLNVLSLDEEEAANHVLRRFEWFIQRIFE